VITKSADSIYEAYIDLIGTDSTWVESVTTSTGDPSKIDYTFVTWKGRLKKAIGSDRRTDSKRLFSRELKEELFQQDNTCKICGQKIILIHDAALDHEEQYWAGGHTVPENARLVHRHCNVTRSRK
jgi:hypothetical protein